VCSTTRRSPSRWRRPSMWEILRRTLARLWRHAQQSAEERRVIEERERFWAELREGQREAAARSAS